MGYRRISGAALIAIMLAVVGCGGTNGSNSVSAATGSKNASNGAGGSIAATDGGSGGTLSKEELISKAEIVCKNLNAKLAAINSSVHTVQEVLVAAQKRAAVEQTAVVDLAKLKPPASVARDWEQILGTRRLLIEELSEVATDAEANNMKSVYVVLRASGGVQEQMADTAKQIGFQECSHVG